MTTSALILPASPERYPWRRRWFGAAEYWVAQLLFWGLLVAFLLATNDADPKRPEHESEIRVSVIVVGCIGVVLTHLLRLGILALRARAKSWLSFFGGTLLINLAQAMAYMGTLWGLGAVFTPDAMLETNGLPPTLVDYLKGVGFFFALLSVWAGFYLGYCYYRGYREGVMDRLRLQAAVKEAELRTLKAQVNPHFLFNSLNTLRSMLPAELDRPREAVTLLAELLRAALTLGDRATVSVADELETVRNYLALEQLRFEQRLRVHEHVDSAAIHLPVPPFLLQTLVENAVKFGVGTRRDGGDVTYEVKRCDAALLLRVTNSGRLGTASESTGLGIANARARLLHLFGPAASLTLAQTSDDLVVAEARIPVRGTSTISP
jgi:hypothetical protein